MKPVILVLISFVFCVNAVSFFDLVKEEWNDFKVSFLHNPVLGLFEAITMKVVAKIYLVFRFLFFVDEGDIQISRDLKVAIEFLEDFWDHQWKISKISTEIPSIFHNL
jgi:hypothetical protein